MSSTPTSSTEALSSLDVLISYDDLIEDEYEALMLLLQESIDDEESDLGKKKV